MDGSRFALRSHILIERDAQTEDVVLIDSHSGTMCSCNTAAAFLVLRLEDGATEELLAAALSAEFNVSVADARRDMGRFLESLSAQGFLEFREAGRPLPAVERGSQNSVGRTSMGLAELPA